MGRQPRRDPGRGRGVPDGRPARARARPRPRDGHVHRHRRRHDEGLRAGRPPVAQLARRPPRAGPRAPDEVSRARDRHGWRRLPRGLRRPGARGAGRVLDQRWRAPARPRDPRRPPHGRMRGDGAEARRGRRAHRRPRRGARRGRRSPGVEHRARPRRRLGAPVHGPRRARSQGRSRRVAPLRGWKGRAGMSDLLYEVKDKIATITLNRPAKINAFTAPMVDAWAKALAEAQADDGVNVVVVTGTGRAFCSGGDVGRMREGQPSALDGKNSLWEGIHRVPKTLEAMDKPVIAMVNGLAVGAGMGMCVMCDMRVAAESARFSTGYVRVGLVPGDGDTYFLPRLVGAAKALELLWTADFIEAPEAHRLGIVQRLAPDAQLKDVTYALARQIADGPQIPVRMIKRLVYQSLRLDLRTHLDLVSSHMSIVRQTADHAEGVAAFKEKRPPKFQGR